MDAKPYADPYLVGLALGLVLLTSFVVMGRGLGASGAFASAASGVVAAASPAQAKASPFFSRYAGTSSPWQDWLIFELIGAMVGGAVSAWLAGRWRRQIEGGAGVAAPTRMWTAFAGGAVMAVGAVLARGCTSGQALTGGAMLSAGSWLFMIAAFAGAYAVAPLVRGLWR
jgi:hypothetical protein